jgi:hypothetical protein
VADLNKAVEADCFARWHFALDHYRPLVNAKTLPVRLWVLRSLESMAQRLLAFVPDEDHPGEQMAADSIEDPARAAAEWGIEADEVAKRVDPAHEEALERSESLAEDREEVLRAHSTPDRQAELAPGFLDAFDAVWDEGPGHEVALVPDALFAGFLRNNLLKERAEAATLYEEAAEALRPAVLDERDFALRATLAGTLFRASYAHKFAGNEDRAEAFQRKGRNLSDF